MARNVLKEFLISLGFEVDESKYQAASKKVKAFEEKASRTAEKISKNAELKGGWTPVVDGQGHFQVEEMEDDMLLFGTLLVKVLEFQYADFFTGLLSRLGITLEEPEELLERSKEVFTGQAMSANTSLAP